MRRFRWRYAERKGHWLATKREAWIAANWALRHLPGTKRGASDPIEGVLLEEAD